MRVEAAMIAETKERESCIVKERERERVEVLAEKEEEGKVDKEADE